MSQPAEALDLIFVEWALQLEEHGSGAERPTFYALDAATLMASNNHIEQAKQLSERATADADLTNYDANYRLAGKLVVVCIPLIKARRFNDGMAILRKLKKRLPDESRTARWYIELSLSSFETAQKKFVEAEKRLLATLAELRKSDDVDTPQRWEVETSLLRQLVRIKTASGQTEAAEQLQKELDELKRHPPAVPSPAR